MVQVEIWSAETFIINQSVARHMADMTPLGVSRHITYLFMWNGILGGSW